MAGGADPGVAGCWRSRAAIRIGDIMRMSSGIRINAPSDPDYDESSYADHLYLYTGTVNSFEWAATRPPQWPPDAVGRYRNTDPVLTSYLIRLAVEALGGELPCVPAAGALRPDRDSRRSDRDRRVRQLPRPGAGFHGGSRLGAARQPLSSGRGLGRGEDSAEGYVEYASTVAPAWDADGRRVYGGAFFWVNGERERGLPETAYQMRGAGGQSTTIVPSHGLVVARLGKYSGAEPAAIALEKAFALLLEAVPSLED